MRFKSIVSSTVVGIAAMAASVSVFAAGDTPGFYVGGAVGKSKVHELCGLAGPGVACSDTDTAAKVYAGYQFNRNFAVEGGFVNFGKSSLTDGTGRRSLKMNAFTVAAVGSLPLGNQFSLFGKVGGFDSDVKLTATDSSGSASLKEGNTNLLYGVGARWDFTKSLGLRVEFERYIDVGGHYWIRQFDVDLLSAGLSYKF